MNLTHADELVTIFGGVYPNRTKSLALFPKDAVSTQMLREQHTASLLSHTCAYRTKFEKKRNSFCIAFYTKKRFALHSPFIYLLVFVETTKRLFSLAERIIVYFLLIVTKRLQCIHCVYVKSRWNAIIWHFPLLLRFKQCADVVHSLGSNANSCCFFNYIQFLLS